MAINSDDMVGALLNEQARLNFIADDGDVNNLVADLVALADPVGVSTETLTPTATHPPHTWDDSGSNTLWGFFSWG
jgi:hypothetical protein